MLLSLPSKNVSTSERDSRRSIQPLLKLVTQQSEYLGELTMVTVKIRISDEIVWVFYPDPRTSPVCFGVESLIPQAIFKNRKGWNRKIVNGVYHFKSLGRAGRAFHLFPSIPRNSWITGNRFTRGSTVIFQIVFFFIFQITINTVPFKLE